jgi:rhodanese-related sulfurtransferase
MKFKKLIFTIFLVLSNQSFALDVNITKEIESIEVIHNGKDVTIKRNQDINNKINPDYAKTSRKCPPFCIQPGKLNIGVETVTEIEVIKYLEKMNWGEPVAIIDSRTKNWVDKGTIPGSVNIPWTRFNLTAGGNTIDIIEILTTQLGIKENEELLDFRGAKTLVLFCNGSWCGQSAASIKTLLTLGYPAHKLKWYRGGIQAWESFGLTIVK